MPSVDTLNVNGTDYDIEDMYSVHFDKTQELTSAQKTQVKSNIGAESINTCVKYTATQELTSEQKTQARNNIGAENAGESVKFSEAQTLTDAQKNQARTNIGAEKSGEAVKFSESQSLTDSQKTQARNNIGGASTEEVDELKSAIEQNNNIVGVYPTFEHEGYLNEGGTYINRSSYRSVTTYLMPCNAGDTFYYKGRATETAVSALFYNGATIIGNSHVYNSGIFIEITIPQGCNFVRFSSYASSGQQDLLVIRKDGQLVYEVEQIAKDLTDTQTALNNLDANVKKTTGAIGAIIYPGEYSSQTLFTVSDVPVGSKIYYDFSAPSGTAGYIDILDSNDTRIKYIGKGTSADPNNYEGEYVLPNNYAKVVATVPLTKVLTIRNLGLNRSIQEIDKQLENYETIVDEISEISEYKTPENIFDPNVELYANCLLKSDGTLQENQTGYTVTDFLSVSDEYESLVFARNNSYGYQIEKTMVAATIVSIIFYRENKSIISASISIWSSSPVTIPSGSKYFRIATHTAFFSQDFAINYNTLKAYSAYFEPHYTAVTDDVEIPNRNLLKNYVHPSNWGASNASVAISDSVITATGDGQDDEFSAYSQESAYVEVGYYYCRATFRVLGDNCESVKLQPVTIGSRKGEAYTINGIASNHWYTLGWISKVPFRGTCDKLFEVVCTFESAVDAEDSVLSVKNVMICSLSNLADMKLYQLDRIPYFTDEATIDINHCISASIYGDEVFEFKNKVAFQGKPGQAAVTFVADDGHIEDFEKMHVLSEKYGVPMCSALPSLAHTMDMTQILYAQNQLGWEFASHTYNHYRLAELTSDAEIIYELVASKKYMEENGIKCYSMVYPEGSNNAKVRRLTKDYYEMACNTIPKTNTGVIPSFYLCRPPLGSFYAEGEGTYEHYKALVDYAIANNGWLIFMLHPRNPKHDSTQQQYFEQIIQYIQQNDVPIVTLHEGYKYFGNALEVGDYTDQANPGNAVVISYNGQKIGLS